MANPQFLQMMNSQMGQKDSLKIDEIDETDELDS